MTRFAGTSNWVRNGHMTQAEPIRVDPETISQISYGIHRQGDMSQLSGSSLLSQGEHLTERTLQRKSGPEGREHVDS